MKLVTLDSIIRTHLIESGLVWHDYFRVLTIAISGLRELAKDINIQTNVKAVMLDVTPTGRVYIPSDSTGVINLFVEKGDKVLPMSRTDNIHPLTKTDDAGTPVKRSPYGENLDNVFLNTDYFYATSFNNKGEYLGRNFGTPNPQPYMWQQFGNEIQLDARLDFSCILLIYNTDGTKVSDVNMVHPLAEDPIKSYIIWKWSERGQRKGIWENQNEKKEFHAKKRALYARIHGLTMEEYVRTTRELLVNAPKQ